MNRAEAFVFNKVINHLRSGGTFINYLFPWIFMTYDPFATMYIKTNIATMNDEVIVKGGNGFSNGRVLKRMFEGELEEHIKSTLRRCTNYGWGSNQKENIELAMQIMEEKRRLAIDSWMSVDTRNITIGNDVYRYKDVYMLSFRKMSKADYHFMQKRDLMSGLITSRMEETFVKRIFGHNAVKFYPMKTISQSGYRYLYCNNTYSKLPDKESRSFSVMVAEHKEKHRLQVVEINTQKKIRVIQRRTGEVFNKHIEVSTTNRGIVDLNKGKIFQVRKRGRTVDVRDVSLKDCQAKGMNSMIFIDSALRDMVIKDRLAAGYYINKEASIQNLVRLPNLSKFFFHALRHHDCANKVPMSVSGDGEACRILGIPTNLSQHYASGFIAQLMSVNKKKIKRITIDEAKSIAYTFFHNEYGNSFTRDDYDPIRNETDQVPAMTSRFVSYLLQYGWTSKKIINYLASDCSNIVDSARFIKDLKKGAIANVMKATRDARELHQTLYDMYCVERNRLSAKEEKKKLDQMKKESKPFKYQPALLKSMTMKINGFSFAPAHDVPELYSVGNMMGICVYNDPKYRARAASGAIVLVIVKDSEGSVINCMEVKGNVLAQAKAYRNRRPKQDVRDAIKYWAYENKIDVTHCYDLGYGDDHYGTYIHEVTRPVILAPDQEADGYRPAEEWETPQPIARNFDDVFNELVEIQEERDLNGQPLLVEDEDDDEWDGICREVIEYVPTVRERLDALLAIHEGEHDLMEMPF